MSRWRWPDRWARLHRATSLLVGDDARLAANADEVRSLLGAFPADDVLDYWTRERVLVLAVERAAGVGLREPVWDEAAAELRAYASRRAGLIDLVGLRVSRALEQAGITPVVLKGPQLAERLHLDVVRRAPSSDIDILVPTEDLFRAQDVLVGIGWERSTDPLLSNGLPIHHLSLPGPNGAPNVELHWRVQWYDNDHAAGLLDRAVRHDGLTVPDDVDILSILLLCWARDGFHGLRLGADVAAWWRTIGSQRFSATERLWQPSQLVRTLTTAAQAASVVLGTPIPSSSPTDRAARLAIAVAATDRPRRPRVGGLTQRAVIDLLTCPAVQRRDRLMETWVLNGRVSHHEHAWAPPILVPGLRGVSALRTTWGSLPIMVRAAIR